jgi:hypothetical protein
MSNKRILDKNTYSTKTLDVFQIVSAYIVDIYYNHLYVEAVKFKNEGKVSSITEGYRHTIYAFLKAMDTNSKTYKAKHYTTMLQGINEYFITWTSFSTLTVADCINKITEEFVPTDYYKSLDMDQKRNILRTLLIQIIKEFSKIVAQEYISLIIDHHDNIDNVNILKDKMIDCMMLQRENMYQQFLDTKVGKAAESIDKNLAVKMQKEIKNLLAEKEKLVDENTSLKKSNQITQDNSKLLIEKYKDLFKRYKTTKEEYLLLKNKYDDQTRKLQGYPMQNIPMQSTGQSMSQNYPMQNMSQNMSQNYPVQSTGIISKLIKPTIHKPTTNKPPSPKYSNNLLNYNTTKQDNQTNLTNQNTTNQNTTNQNLTNQNTTNQNTTNQNPLNRSTDDKISISSNSDTESSSDNSDVDLDNNEPNDNEPDDKDNNTEEDTFNKLSSRVNSQFNKKTVMGMSPSIADIY